MTADVDELTLCPSCKRLTRTVGQGACAECWLAKSSAGQRVIQPREPRTTPIFGSLDDVPTYVWAAIGTAFVAAIIRALIFVLG
jgi:hypothetical protein